MKTPLKILVAFSFLITGFLLTSFYYQPPERHMPEVFLTKMNVLYIGVDNYVDVAACNVAPADLDVKISGGTLSPTGKPGSFIIRVTGGIEATVKVAMYDTVKTELGCYRFRIKRVPDPVAYLGNIKADGSMPKAELQKQAGIFARMENFDFDLKFSVVSFKMSLIENGKWKETAANGPALTAEMKTDLNGILLGDVVLFHDVIVKGPDGTLRKIPGVMITVK